MPIDTRRHASRDGGRDLVWARDGRELYYRQGNAMMAVAVDTAGAALSFEPAVALFDTVPYSSSFSTTRRSCDVAADERFLTHCHSVEIGAANNLSPKGTPPRWFG